MAGFSLPGLGSGIDVKSLADALFDQLTLSNKIRNNSVSARQNENTSLGKLRTLLTDLASTLDSARNANGGAAAKKATSTNSQVATATADTSATLGTFSVTVSKLATGGSGSFDKSFTTANDFVVSDAAAAGNVHFTVGSGDDEVQFDVSVDETTTAQDFVNEFNANANGKASASIVNVGTSAAPDFRITFRSNEIGEEQGSVVVSADNAQTLGASGLVATTLNQATDAEFTVSGVAGTIKRSSNSVSDVIPGVTITLAAEGTTTIGVQNDAGSVKSKVKDFIAAYNALQKFVATEDKITSTTQGGQIQNNFGSLVRTNVDDDALSSLRFAISGARSSDGTTSLAAVGVSTNRDGSLAFDEKKFDAAFASNASAVNEAVSSLADKVSGVQGAVYQFTGYGLSIDQATKANDAEIANVNKKIQTVETSATKQQEALIRQFSKLDGLIARLNADSTYIQSLFSF